MAKKKGESSDSRNDTVSATSITPLKAFLTHLLCGIGLVSAFYVAKNIYSINLIDNPAETLRLTWVGIIINLMNYVKSVSFNPFFSFCSLLKLQL